MKKRITVLHTLLLMLLAASVAAAGVFYYLAIVVQNDKLAQINEKEKLYAQFDNVRSIINDHFIGDYDKSAMMTGALSGYISALDDKWSCYLTADVYSEYIKAPAETSGTLNIICVKSADNKALLVLEVPVGSSAEKAGLLPGDFITEVDGLSMNGLDFAGASRKLLGAQGSVIRLGVKREGESIEITAMREFLPDLRISGKMLANNIGYIRAGEFTRGSNEEFRTALDNLTLAGAKAIVLDLRNNSGNGDMLAGFAPMLDYLLPEGIILTEEIYYAGKIEQHPYKSDAISCDLPMAVLVNQFTVCEAEYFAAALSEGNGAITVGTVTAGKGRRQQAIDIRGGSGIILSNSRYLTSKGLDLSKIGITPEIILETQCKDAYNLSELPENEDAHLLAAVQALSEKLAAPPANSGNPNGVVPVG